MQWDAGDADHNPQGGLWKWPWAPVDDDVLADSQLVSLQGSSTAMFIEVQFDCIIILM